jgi:hypothetical protein
MSHRMTVLLMLLAGCDLDAAYESYRDRFCAEACVGGSDCPPRCLVTADGGLPDGGVGRLTMGPHGFFASPGADTFLVLRLETFRGPGPAAATFLEERLVSTGELVRAELLNERGLALSTSFEAEGTLTRSEDERRVTVALAPNSSAMSLSEVTMAHRVLVVGRAGLEWKQVFPGFAQSNLGGVVSVDESLFWGAGDRGLGRVEGDGGSALLPRTDTSWRNLQAFDGRLYAATFRATIPRVEELGPLRGPLPDGGATVVSFGANQLVRAFAFTRAAGVDALYVAERDSLWRYARDGGTWVSAWSLDQPQPPCSFLAARVEGPVLCTAGSTLYRIDEGAAGAQLKRLIQVTSDGGENTFRGVAYPPR